VGNANHANIKKIMLMSYEEPNRAPRHGRNARKFRPANGRDFDLVITAVDEFRT
jgi:hypothetical protein